VKNSAPFGNEMLLYKNLRKISDTLFKRVHHRGLLYCFVIIIFALLIASYAGISLFTNFIDFKNESEKQTDRCVIIFVLFYADIATTLYSYKKKKNIDRYKLNIFPYSSSNKSLSLALLNLIDYKSIYYLFICLVYLGYFIFILHSVSGIIFCLTVFLIMYLSISMITSMILTIFDKYLTRGDTAAIAVLSFVFIFNLINLSKQTYWLQKTPIIGNTGKMLYFLENDNYSAFFHELEIYFLIFLMILSIFLLFINYSAKYYKYGNRNKNILGKY
jgi:ABC-type uncharacterized transport system fused permease/ATPase subunit